MASKKQFKVKTIEPIFLDKETLEIYTLQAKKMVEINNQARQDATAKGLPVIDLLNEVNLKKILIQGQNITKEAAQ